jgi:hypothetical protein
MLENQCRTWPDPIVAAVYVPLVRGRDGGRPAIPTYRNTTLDDVIRGERAAASPRPSRRQKGKIQKENANRNANPKQT